MRIILILVLLPAIAYAATIGYLRYEVTEQANKLVKASSPFAHVNYGSVHTSWLGDEVGITDVIIMPNMTDDIFHVGGVRLSAPHIGYFLNAEDAWGNTLPENIGIEIQRLELDLNSQLLAVLEQGEPEDEFDLTSFDAVGCGDKVILDIDDFVNMGIDKVTLNIALKLLSDEENNTVTAKMRYEDDHSSADIEVRYTDVSLTNFVALSQKIPDVSIKSVDNGYYRLRNEYCAKLNGGTVEQYVERNIAILTEALETKPPQKLTEAYRQYMLEGGELAITIRPSQNVPMRNLDLYSDDEVLQILGLNISIRGQNIDSQQLAQFSDTAVLPHNTEKQPSSAQVITPASPSPSPTRPARRPAQPSYHTVSVSQLHKHLGRPAKISLLDGREHQGTLDKVNDWRVQLVIRSYTGSMTIPVKIEDIDAVRVMY